MQKLTSDQCSQEYPWPGRNRLTPSSARSQARLCVTAAPRCNHATTEATSCSTSSRGRSTSSGGRRFNQCNRSITAYSRARLHPPQRNMPNNSPRFTRRPAQIGPILPSTPRVNPLSLATNTTIITTTNIHPPRPSPPAHHCRALPYPVHATLANNIQPQHRLRPQPRHRSTCAAGAGETRRG